MTPSELESFCERLQNLLDHSLSASRWLKKKLAVESLPDFATEVLISPEEVAYWPRLSHVKEWMRLVAEHKKLLVEAARDHFKSTFFSWAYPLYLLQRVHRKEEAFGIALFSYSENQAQKNLKRVRQEIENNDWLKWLVPRFKSSVWDASTLDCSNFCWVEAYGFGSSFRGRHPKYIIVDDPSKDEGTGSMSLEQQIQFFSGVIVPAAKRGSQIIVTGNPVAKKDFLEWLEGNRAFSSFFYPVMGADGRLLAEEHYGAADVEDKRMAIPAHIFAREYMLRRVAAEDAKFREEWFRYYEVISLLDRPLYKILTIDPALSPGGDAMAAVLTGTDSSKRTFVLDRLNFRGEFQSGIERLCDLIARNLPIDRIGTETFAFQRMYKVWLEEELKRRGLGVHIEEVGRDSRKSKAARIEALQPKLAQGKLLFRRDDKLIVDQFILWDPQSRTNEDDLIDALSWQVPMWRGPLEDEPEERFDPRPGTFAAAVDEMRHSNDGWLGKLFQDLEMVQ